MTRNLQSKGPVPTTSRSLNRRQHYNMRDISITHDRSSKEETQTQNLLCHQGKKPSIFNLKTLCTF